MRGVAVIAAGLGIHVLVSACALAPTPSGPCLGDLPEIQNISFDELTRVEADLQGDTEVVRFVFDPAGHGVGSVTAQRARGPFTDAGTGEAISPQGDRLTGIRFEGLGGVLASRLRADPGSRTPVRDVVQVADPNETSFVIGTMAGACLRLRVDPASATVTVLVSPP